MSRHPAPFKTCRYSDNMVGDEYESDFSDDSFSSDDDEPRIPPTRKGMRDPRKYGNYGRFDAMSSTTYSTSNFSSSLDTTESSLMDGYPPPRDVHSDMYARIQRGRAPSPPPVTFSHGMRIEQDISPISHDSAPSRLPHRLELNRMWRPQQTSTTLDMQYSFPVPKTNPHLSSVGGFACSTPSRPTNRMVLTSYDQVLNMEQKRPKSYHEIEKHPDRVWDNTRPASTATLRSPDNSGLCNPEHYGMHITIARNKGIKGILFLTMTANGSLLSVTVNRAAYFTEKYDLPMTTYVKLEIRSRSRKRQTSSSRMRKHEERQPQAQRTQLLRSSNIPEFRSNFIFRVDPRERHQQLFISVWAMNQEHSNAGVKSKKMIGCMTFHISRMFAKVKDSNRYYEENNETVMEEMLVSDGGFFLLNEKHGEKNNLPQHKISRQEFYELSGSCGLTTSSFSSSGGGGGHYLRERQMPMEEFAIASKNFGTSMVPGYSTAGDRLQDESSASSSAFSREGVPNYHYTHRSTLPNIITTSDSSEHDVYSGPSGMQRQDVSYLYVDANQNDRKHKPRAGSPHQTTPTSTKHVRRATSFTFSPKDSVDKYNKRPVQVKDKEEKEERRKLFGPISKTISYIRNKMDTALSNSSLCPTSEDLQQWETCFDSLLRDKNGRQLFHQFLQKCVCDENLDFWADCEEFKRMKEGKKDTAKKAHDIYNRYIHEGAEKQVNIDSDTRTATKAALESGCRTDTFNLAQTQIEQLMKTNSYKRFFQDPIYLDLVKQIEENEAQKRLQAPAQPQPEA